MEKLIHLNEEIHYELVNLLAEGGMGLVYEGRQYGADEFCKSVAIKLIREEYSNIEEFRKNFIGEARLVADLIHTNIVQTYHLGETKGQYFIVMELVKGYNLGEFTQKHLATGQQVPVDLAVFIVSRICRGLAYAHQSHDLYGRPLGIVHRDVGPKNILLAHEGDVKLTDFGIAKALDLMYNEEGQVVAGKDEYLSPEQARKEVTDERADIFPCGILLSELLLGYNIFEGEDGKDTRDRIINLQLPDFTRIRKGIDEKLNTILHKALQRDRDARYQKAYDFLTDLERYIYGDGYGPTNEKLAIYLKNLFGTDGKNAVKNYMEQCNNHN